MILVRSLRAAMAAFLFAGVLAFSGLVSADDVPLRVNVNTADAAMLADYLDGVGLKKAEEIVRYREQNGAFGDIADLANVKGIGMKTVARNQQKITLKE